MFCLSFFYIYIYSCLLSLYIYFELTINKCHLNNTIHLTKWCLIRVCALSLALHPLFVGKGTLRYRSPLSSSAQLNPKALRGAAGIHMYCFWSCMWPCLLPLFHFCLPNWAKAQRRTLKACCSIYSKKERGKT